MVSFITARAFIFRGKLLNRQNRRVHSFGATFRLESNSLHESVSVDLILMHIAHKLEGGATSNMSLAALESSVVAWSWIRR